MRRAVLGLLAAAGCNQIWGLDPVGLAGDGPRIRLTAQIANTKDQGLMDPVLGYAPLAPAPVVQLGLIDGSLADARYNADDGTVVYPSAFVGRPWRLVYTLADGIPREVHWSPPEGDLVAQLVEPLFGRVERMPVPAGGGYAITPFGSPAHNALTRVFTTGLWTDGVFGATSPGATLDYDFEKLARSLSGPRGAPEKARSDHGVLADFKNLNGCRVSTGVAMFTVPDMVAGTHTSPDSPPVYFSADKQAHLILPSPPMNDLIESRLQKVLGSRAMGTDLDRMEYGYTPSLGVFGFSKPAPSAKDDFYLPGPQVLALANCTWTPGPTMVPTEVFADLDDLGGLFPRVAHVEVVNQRVKGPVTLTSGYSAVVTSSGYYFTVDFSVAAPRSIKLLRGGVQIADLEELTAEDTPLPAGTDPIDLVFDVESATNLAADSFEIALYSLASGTPDLQRIYSVTEHQLRIDPSVLQPGIEYVFEVRAYRGRPEAARANFATNAYPQYAASIFTRTFTMSP